MNTLPIDLSVYMTPFVIILGVLARGLWLWLGLGLVDRGNPRNTPSRALLISIVYSLGLYALLASPLLLTLAPRCRV